MTDFLAPLLGGTLIGFAVSLMLWLNGRVTGISGIVNGLLRREKGETAWRVAFLSGLISGGAVLYTLYPEWFPSSGARGPIALLVAGFLVGFGTVMGGGCTSGHGVCGISRLSLRSIAATVTFMLMGMAVVWLF